MAIRYLKDYKNRIRRYIAISIYRLALAFIFLAIILIAKLSGKAQGLPIKPTRSISFETDEGSYMDIDLSPDGTKILFTLLGDIYIKPIKGGDVIQLTHGLAYNVHPVWSPNGKKIAYISDASGAAHVNIMNADGSSQRTLDASGVQIELNKGNVYAPPCIWTPDSEFVVVNNRMFNIAGGSIPLTPQVKDIIQFSSNENIIYHHKISINGESDTIKKYDCYFKTEAGFAVLPKGAVNPKISLDEKWLSYITKPDFKSDLIIRNLITGKEEVIISGIENHYRTMQENYAFTNDSHYLTIGFKGKIHKIDVQDLSDEIIPFKAYIHVEMGDLDYNRYKITHDSVQIHYIRSANENSDGRSLVFSALGKIYLMKIPNGTPYPLVEQSLSQYQPVFSPDGKWIVYVTRSDTKGGAVWRISSGGGKPEKLTNDEKPCIYSIPSWSPDERFIAVLKDTGVVQGFAGQLQIISVKDHCVRSVADNIFKNNILTFSPDGSRIIFKPLLNYRLEREQALVSMNINDKSLYPLAYRTSVYKRLTRLIEPESPSDEELITISPDSQYIVYEINQDLYLSPLTTLSEAPMLNSTSGTLPIIRFSKGVDMHWEMNGRLLCWSYANQFYRINPHKIVLAAIRMADDASNIGLHDNGVFHINVVPDETISMNIKTSKYYAHGTIALRDVRIVSMKDNEVIEHGTIVIADGRFISVGPNKDVHIPLKAKILNLKGKTIIPGLIDLHDHLEGLQNQYILEQQSWTHLANLAYGITTSRDPSSTFESFGRAELLETGRMAGPRLFTVGEKVSYNIERFPDALSTVEKRATFGAIAVKQYSQSTRLQKQWLLIASHEAELNMTNEGDYCLQGDLAMIKDGSTGIEHAVIWGNVYNDIIRFVAQSQTWLTPTLQARAVKFELEGKHYFRELFKQHPDTKLSHFWPPKRYQDLLKSTSSSDSGNDEFKYLSSIYAKIFHSGGHIGMGAHGNDPGIGSHWEMRALQMGGLTNQETLRIATINGAEALGLQQDLGSIEVGKIADLIILDKSPLDDIRNTLTIRYVMKDGELYDGNTLNTVWPVKKKLPEWKFQPVSTQQQTKSK